MRYTRHLLPMLALLLCASAVFAQKNPQQRRVIIKTADAEIPPDIPKDTVKKIEAIIQKAFDKYVEYNSLKDDAPPYEITKKSLENFHSLFSVNAEIADDVTEPTEINGRIEAAEERNHSDYGGKMFRLFPKEGLTTLITEARLDRITFDSAGYYRVVLSVEKRLRNRYNPVSKKATAKAPYRCYNLNNFLYDVPADLKREAKIFGVSGKATAACPPFVPPPDPHPLPGTPPGSGNTKITRPPHRHLGFSAFVRLGVGSLSDHSRSFLNDKTQTISHSGLALDTKSTLGGGLSVQIPLGQSGTYIGLGLAYHSTSATAGFDLLRYVKLNRPDEDKQLPPVLDANPDYYVSIRNAEERIRLNSIEFSPGIGKVWHNSEKKLGFGAEVQLILRNNSAKGTLSADSATYRGVYKKLDWTTPDNDDQLSAAYGYFRYPVNGLSVQYGSKFSAGLRLSPTLRVRISDSSVLNIGADYDLMFGTVLTSNEKDGHILQVKGTQTTGKEESIAYNYLEPVKWGAANLYLRAGVTFALSKK